MAIGPIENLDEFHKVVNSPVYDIIEFWAARCDPCTLISPTYVRESDKPENVRLQFYRVDTDLVEGAREEANMPTFIVFHNGKMLHEVVGAKPTELEFMIAAYA
ncbi:thioredoxin-like protein [Mycena albidolilacea]|uniref:Thioredoxin-like protein n=1 Tax=Mycena albidolilacea TaxID=1033008 RepID=A0AAD6ZRY1_9AGAR|nr:thioredoxin-like protein [Mycena albidolilacea]